MDGFSTLANALSGETQNQKNSKEFISFGAIHLNITDVAKASFFWTKIVGMKQRHASEKSIEFGSEERTLVVVHETASSRYQRGYSGLYHFAIHATNKQEFARMVHRLNVNNYPYSPVDHTMSKAIYLDDPDGINIEFTLETPERLKRVLTSGGLRMEGTDGITRSASDRLDIAEVLRDLKDENLTSFISKGSYIGHIHLYANNLENSNNYYEKLAFQQFNHLPKYMYADLGAGGDFQHRIAMNTWHGKNRPLAPVGSAGLRYFHLKYDNYEILKTALSKISHYEQEKDGHWLVDPTGIKLLITHDS